MDKIQKKLFKKNIKRRIIELLFSIPFGIGFAYLFYYLNLSIGLQLFLTVICWGAVIGLIELVYLIGSNKISKKLKDKPKRRDPFAD